MILQKKRAPECWNVYTLDTHTRKKFLVNWFLQNKILQKQKSWSQEGKCEMACKLELGNIFFKIIKNLLTKIS